MDDLSRRRFEKNINQIAKQITALVTAISTIEKAGPLFEKLLMSRLGSIEWAEGKTAETQLITAKIRKAVHILNDADMRQRLNIASQCLDEAASDMAIMVKSIPPDKPPAGR